jgi:hypothetical protein
LHDRPDELEAVAHLPIRDEASLAADFERMREIAGRRLGFEVFKRSSFQQFIRQAEIDVLGLRFGDAGPVAIAVDSAFHEDGVLYVNRQETVSRILKKMIRTAFALEAYFDVHEADVVFATPKMHNAIWDDRQGCWPALQSILADCGSLSAARVNLCIAANDDFAKEIIQPVLDRMDEVADTSGLFLRAQKLARLCEVAPRQPQMRRNSTPARPGSESEPKFGEHVRQTMAGLAQAARLTPQLIGNLLDARYCKMAFNLAYPLLRAPHGTAVSSTQRGDRNGHARYWSKLLKIGEHRFYMCNHWFEPQRAAFDRWVRELGLRAQSTASKVEIAA